MKTMPRVSHFSRGARLSFRIGFFAAAVGIVGAAHAQAPVELITNGGFESTVIPTDSFKFVQAPTLPGGFTAVNGSEGAGDYQAGTIDGWMTTSFSTSVNQYVVELWNGSFGSPAAAPSPYEGNQYAEMDSVSAGTLFQNVTNVAPGSTLFLSFAHSGRGGVSGSQMRVSLFDLGANGTFNSTFATPGNTTATLGGDDSFLIDQLIGPSSFSSSASPITNNWTFYSFQLPVTTSHNMLLAFQSVTGSTQGNFLDSVSLSNVQPTGVAAPEPGSFALLLPVLGTAGAILRRRKK